MVFCAPPTWRSCPPTTVPPNPAGFVTPAGRVKFTIGPAVGLAAGDSGPPVQARSTEKSASPALRLSDSSPTTVQFTVAPGGTVTALLPPLCTRTLRLVAKADAVAPKMTAAPNAARAHCMSLIDPPRDPRETIR